MYGLAAAIAKALALLSVPYLTRALSPSGYGIADLATSTAAFLTLLAAFSGDIPAGRRYGVAKSEAARRRVLSSYVWATAVVGITIAILLLPVASAIAATLWDSPDLSLLAALSLVLVPISAIQAGLVQTQRIQSRPTRVAVLSLADLLAQLGLAVALVAAGLGPHGVVLGFILGSVVGLIVAAAAARDVARTPPDWAESWRLVMSGVQFLPHIAAFVAADWSIRSIVAIALGPEAVADLGLALRVASVLTLLGAAFAMAWGPIGLARARDSATATLFGRVLAAYGAASVAGAFMLAAIGPELIPIVAGPGYGDAALILPGFALAYAIAGTEYVLVIAAGLFDRPMRVAVAATIGAIVQVSLAALIVPQVGIFAIGPVVVLGRALSFTILLSGVRSSVVVPLLRLAGLGAFALLAFAVVHLSISQDGSMGAARWGLAVAMGVIAILITLRAVRPRRSIAA